MITRNVILVGPMGVGKTTIGRALAKLLHLEFVDSDQRIEDRTGVSISTIFDFEGEDGFRKREETIIEELTRLKGVVLATGGGAILSESNRVAMRNSGIVVYLHAPVDMQMDRTRNSRNRPLLEGGDRREILEKLMEEREPLYRQEADLVVVTDTRTPQAVAQDIAQEVRNLC